MSFQVEYFPVDTTVSANRFVILSGTPVSSNNVAMDTISGTAQALNGDFAVDSTKVKWDSTAYGLYNQIGSGDTLRIIYDRS